MQPFPKKNKGFLLCDYLIKQVIPAVTSHGDDSVALRDLAQKGRITGGMDNAGGIALRNLAAAEEKLEDSSSSPMTDKWDERFIYLHEWLISMVFISR